MTVVPENPVAIEIIELGCSNGVGFSAMFEVLISFLCSFHVYFRTQSDNQLEILALRHQIAVLQRKTPKPKLKSADRRLWAWLSQYWPRWRSALLLVKRPPSSTGTVAGSVGTGPGRSDTDMLEGQAFRKKHGN